MSSHDYAARQAEEAAKEMSKGAYDEANRVIGARAAAYASNKEMADFPVSYCDVHGLKYDTIEHAVEIYKSQTVTTVR